MSTIGVEERLYLQTAEIARSQGKSVEQFVTEVLRTAVATSTRQAESPRQSVRNGLPVMTFNGNGTQIEPAEVRRMIEEEGF